MATKKPAAKKPVDYSSKLYIGNELRALDLKVRDYYDSMDEKEKKDLAPYQFIRWGATVEGTADVQAYYLMSANERLNKHYFDISAAQHKKLLWLLATTISPGMGAQRHTWLAGKRRDSSNNKNEKLLREIYPTAKVDEIELMAQLNDKSDLRELARNHGWDDTRIKEYL
jgi:hypothetical protein